MLSSSPPSITASPFSTVVSSTCTSSSLSSSLPPARSATIRLTTSSPLAILMPRTPVAVRPIERTRSSPKRTVLPLEANSRMSRSPSVRPTPTSASPSSRLIAILPRARRNANSLSGVFLTVPLRVAKNTNWPSAYSRTGSTACTRSPDSSGIQLMIGRPRAFEPASGSWCTGSQNTLPELVKVSRVSWVLTSHSCSMKSSSLVDAALRPRPPRRWAR